MSFLSVFLLGVLTGICATYYFDSKNYNELIKLAEQMNRSWERECNRNNDEWCDFFDN